MAEEFPAFVVDGYGFPNKNNLTESYMVLTKSDGDSLCKADTVYTGTPVTATYNGTPAYEFTDPTTFALIGSAYTNTRENLIDVELAPNQAVNYDFELPSGASPVSAFVHLYSIRNSLELNSGTERPVQLIFQVKPTVGATLISRTTGKLVPNVSVDLWNSEADINTSPTYHGETPDADTILGLGQANNLNYVTQSADRANEVANCPYGTTDPNFRQHVIVVSATMTTQIFRLSFYCPYFGGTTSYANLRDNSGNTQYNTPSDYFRVLTPVFGHIIYSWA